MASFDEESSWRPVDVDSALHGAEDLGDELPFVEEHGRIEPVERGVRIVTKRGRLRGAIQPNDRLREPRRRRSLPRRPRAEDQERGNLLEDLGAGRVGEAREVLGHARPVRVRAWPRLQGLWMLPFSRKVECRFPASSAGNTVPEHFVTR